MRIAQVAQAVEPHAWRKPPAELCLGSSIEPRAGRRNAARERAIREGVDVGGHAGSLATIARDV